MLYCKHVVSKREWIIRIHLLREVIQVCRNDRSHRETNKTLLSKQSLYASNRNSPGIKKLNLLETMMHAHSRASYPRERNPPAYDRLHVIEIHDRGISGSDRRTDISANTRLLAPIVPLYTTEIPSKMQEDTGRAGRNS